MWRMFSTRVRTYPLLAAIVLLLLGFVPLSGCGKAEGHASDQGSMENLKPYTSSTMPGLKQTSLPSFVPADIRDAYEFALARPDVLQYMPCYCGCGLNANHTSNLNCFIDGVRADGAIQFDEHAADCGVCVEIARDAQRLANEGRPLKEIRAYVDQAHGKKGPGTNTPLPPG